MKMFVVVKNEVEYGEFVDYSIIGYSSSFEKAVAKVKALIGKDEIEVFESESYDGSLCWGVGSEPYEIREIEEI